MNSAQDTNDRSGQVTQIARPRAYLFFLLIAAPLGLAMLVLTPPFEPLDENNHFFRAYQVSEGVLLPVADNAQRGGILPLGLYETMRHLKRLFPTNPTVKLSKEDVLDALSIPLQTKSRGFVAFTNTTTYPPLAYVPQSLVMAIARWCGSPPIVLLYAARLGNLLGYLIIVALALRVFPRNAWPLAAFAATPAMVGTAAILSADAMTNAAGLLLVALFAKALCAEVRTDFKKCIGALFAATALFLLCKQGYFFLCALVVLLPTVCFGSFNRRVQFLLAYGAWCGLLLLVVAGYTRYVFAPPLVFFVPASEQIHHILGHPVQYAETLARSIWYHAFVEAHTNWAREFVGGRFPYAVAIPFYVAIGTLCATEKKPLITCWRKRVFLVGLVVVNVVFLLTASYVAWSPHVGQLLILYAYARYFFPLVPLLVLAISGNIFSGGRNVARGLALACVVAVAAFSPYFIYQRYYVPERNLLSTIWQIDSLSDMSQPWTPNASLAQRVEANENWMPHNPALAESELKSADAAAGFPNGRYESTLQRNSKLGVFEQNWVSGPSDTSAAGWGLTIANLRPNARYNLYVQVRSASNDNVGIAMYGMRMSGSERVELKRLEPAVIAIGFSLFADYTQTFVPFSGTFLTDTSGVVRLVPFLLKNRLDRPAVAEWKDFVLTRDVW